MGASVFDTSAAERKQSENNIQAEIGIAEKKAAKKKIVSMSLYPESQQKLMKKAKEMGISASSLIEIWISEHC